MGNVVFEGAIVGVLAAVVVLLICVVFIKRRRYLNKLGNKNTRLSNQSPSFHEDDDTSPGTISRAVSTQIYSVQPSISKMTWSIPTSESETKSRSYSYPGRRDAISGESKSSIKRKKTRKYRGSKSDSCYHVCQIQLTVFYNYYLSKLTVQIVCASKLPSTFGLNYGSYIEAELLPSSAKYTTNLQFQTNNPVFDESAEFPDIPSDELLNMTLKLRLYTVDRFSHGTLLGQVTAALADLDLNPEKPTTIWRPIVPSDQQWKLSSSLLSLKDIVDKGELMISLKYQILNSKVTVVIMKAVNLPSISKIFAIDPYVIVTLLLNYKTVQTKKTSIKRRTTSPIWNEPLVFEIDSKIPMTEYSMSFKVKSHNSLSEDLTVGEIKIGSHAQGTGSEHWKDMICKKNYDRARCHTIK